MAMGAVEDRSPLSNKFPVNCLLYCTASTGGLAFFEIDPVLLLTHTVDSRNLH